MRGNSARWYLQNLFYHVQWIHTPLQEEPREKPATSHKRKGKQREGARSFNPLEWVNDVCVCTALIHKMRLHLMTLEEACTARKIRDRLLGWKPVAFVSVEGEKLGRDWQTGGQKLVVAVSCAKGQALQSVSLSISSMRLAGWKPGNMTETSLSHFPHPAVAVITAIRSSPPPDPRLKTCRKSVRPHPLTLFP